MPLDTDLTPEPMRRRVVERSDPAVVAVVGRRRDGLAFCGAICPLRRWSPCPASTA
ncbi:hypothetical protein [Methylobacterium sp. GC_Met_2]|uniref:hypothetical protein n=1 Tax=Methylobacterium sp. GC_Met_2 TaxID=2937376 RepID=UPI00226B3E3C|nr:hypothetical protein [Methylobacterium sp. GC_Met_2]